MLKSKYLTRNEYIQYSHIFHKSFCNVYEFHHVKRIKINSNKFKLGCQTNKFFKKAVTVRLYITINEQYILQINTWRLYILFELWYIFKNIYINKVPEENI